MTRKILVLTDMDSNGSGYRNISVPLFTELTKLDYEVKIIGLMYLGDEHNFPFSIIPSASLDETKAMAGNLCYLWNPDVIIVAMDLPVQAAFHQHLQPFLQRLPYEEIKTLRKYIAISPLENGPLCMTWAAPLFAMDGVFFISELGKQEALKVGVKAEHLWIGVDTVSWRPAFPEEKKQLRTGMGIPEDAFVVLTVADNQERKNLWAGLASICMLTHSDMSYQDVLDVCNGVKKIGDFPKTREDVRYMLVTREKSQFGWKLRDLATVMGINKEYVPFERGMPQQDLWALYALSDVYLQPSKAEGLGLPVLDAMCCKVPVVATDTGALNELLMDKRGLLVRPAHSFIDVWGNESRSMIDVSITAKYLQDIYEWNFKDIIPFDTNPAYEYIKTRTWDIPAKQIDSKIKELLDEYSNRTDLEIKN